MCENAVQQFSKKYDVKASFIRNGSGSTFAKVEAEKNNPQADVWYGGTFDPQSQAGELGLLEPYQSPNLPESLNVSATRARSRAMPLLPFIWAFSVLA